MPGSYEVIVAGDYFADLIFNGLPGMPQLGTEIYASRFTMVPGGTYNSVLALHRLGVRTGWVCDFGSDLFSQFVLERIESEGIDSSLFRLHDRPFQRITASLSFPNDRAFVSYIDEKYMSPGVVTPVVLAQHPAFLVLPGLSYGEEHIRLVNAAHQVGSTVYMDCQGNSATLAATPGLCDSIGSVDFFAPNLSEAFQLTGEDTVEKALETLSQFTSTVIIKMGEKGCMARKRDQLVRLPAIKVDTVDTTGAGDCFNAGFIYGCLKKYPFEQCLLLGNICGGISTTLPGSSGVPYLNQVETAFKNITGMGKSP